MGAKGNTHRRRRRHHQMVLACWEFHEKLISPCRPFSTLGKNSYVGIKKKWPDYIHPMTNDLIHTCFLPPHLYVVGVVVVQALDG